MRTDARPGVGGDSQGAVAVGAKTEIDLARAAIAKATRAEVRLKYSLLADEEINRLLAKRIREFDAAIQSGYIPTLALRMVEAE